MIPLRISKPAQMTYIDGAIDRVYSRWACQNLLDYRFTEE